MSTSSALPDLIPSVKIRDLRDKRRALLSDYQILCGEFYDKDSDKDPRKEAFISIGLPDDMHFMMAEMNVDRLLAKTIRWEEADNNLDTEQDRSEQDNPDQDKSEQIKAQLELFQIAQASYEEDLSQLQMLREKLEDSNKVIGNQFEEVEVVEDEAESTPKPKPKAARGKKRAAAAKENDNLDDEFAPSSAPCSTKKAKKENTPAKSGPSTARVARRKSSSTTPASSTNSTKQPRRKSSAKQITAPPTPISFPKLKTATLPAPSNSSDIADISQETKAENERLMQQLAKLEADMQHKSDQEAE